MIGAFPDNIDNLFDEAKEKAELLRRGLNKGVRLKDLFHMSGNRTNRKKEFFEMLDVEPNATLYNAKRNNELSGLYLFGTKQNGLVELEYLGISNTIARRLKQHGWGTGQNQSSLAYLMAKLAHDHRGFRKDICSDALEEARMDIQELYVSVLPEKDAYKLYFYEVAIAGILRTRWNNFKTH
ncbi:MAG: hypothetical protein EA392_10730 [Cryomorphaceae bacterium]|nr:MAG: hypothetical protein EA392_10730 [Cryomorphaceae bacterium]